MKRIIDNETLCDVVSNIQEHISKTYNPSILEMELILRMLNETIQKKKTESRTNNLASSLLGKVLHGEIK